MTRLRMVVALLLLVGASACDSRPSGPVEVDATLEWDAGSLPAGGALLFLSGPGITEVRGEGGTLVWTHTPPGEEGGVRVLLIQPADDAPIRFSVHLESAARPNPVATVLDLTGRDNARIPVAPAYRVRFAR